MAEFGPDEDLVRRLSALLNETGLTEIEFEANGVRIRVARGSGLPAVQAVPAAPVESAAPHAAQQGGDGARDAEAIPAGAVLAPMVGTAYLAPEPGTDAFVAVGDEVDEGQTLMIIEAMKVMNQIPAPRGGRVSRVLVEDGQPVEYGEPLLVID